MGGVATAVATVAVMVVGVVAVTVAGGREPVPPPSHAAAIPASSTRAVPRQLVLVRFIRP
jgi:hypothetical protein